MLDLWVAVTTATVFFTIKWDLQIVIYLVLFFLIIFGIWIAIFSKDKRINKIYAFLFLLFLISPMILPTVKKSYEQGSCIEDGICAEGTRVKLKGVPVEINKGVCIEYGRRCDDKRKFCDIRNDKF